MGTSPSVKKRNRGGKKRRKNGTSVLLYYVNINGFQSKKESLMEIIRGVEPDTIALVETKVPENKVFDWKKIGYECIKRNDKRGKGGIMCAFKIGTFRSIRNVTQVDDRRILTCRVEYKSETVRVVVAHGPQETDNLELRTEFYINLGIEVEKAVCAGDSVMLVGDMNAKLKVDEDGNIGADSGNGQLLSEMVGDLSLQVMNFSDMCCGKWTWEKVIKGQLNKSQIDYLIVNNQLMKSVMEMEIDEEKSMCPFHKVKGKAGKERLVYSDHNPIICKLKLTHDKIRSPKEPRWIISQAGLIKFKQLTETFQNQGVPNGYSGLEKGIRNAMQSCFHRIWKKQKDDQPENHQQKKLMKCLLCYKKKGKMQRSLVRKYIAKLHAIMAENIARSQKERVEKTVKSLTVNEHFSPNEFWKLKKILCPKNKTESTSIVLENGDELCGDTAIRNAYSHEFESRLEHNKIHEAYESYEEMTNILCELYVNAARKILSRDFTVEEIRRVIKSLKNKKSPGPDEITNEILKYAGEGLLQELVSVMNAIKNDTGSPEQWNKVLITAIFKNKGSKRELVNYRGIFLSSCISKLCEKLIIQRHEETMKNVSLAQNGATKKKSPADNVFITNACIDHAKYLNKAVYMAFYDFKQCFDKLWLEDCIVGLWKIGMRDQMLSLILNMNETSEIVVQSPCGKGKPFHVQRIVKQGTVTGPQLCKVSTAEYGNDTPGFQVGAVNVKPPIFVDDIMSLNMNIADMNESHVKAVLFSYRKRIGYGTPKCLSMVVNAKKCDVSPVLEIDGHVMKLVRQSKYVGDFFNDKGTNKDLIEDRLRKGKGKMISLLALGEESSLGRYTIQTLIFLYTTTFMQMVIFNSRAWSHITKGNIIALERLQLRFLKLILWLPMSTPNNFIFLEYGVLPFGKEIDKRRMTYLHHVLTIGRNDPVHLVYNQSLRLPFEPNWANDVKSLRIEYGITETDEEVSELPYHKWKEIVENKVETRVFEQLCETASKASKTKELAYKSFSTSKYLLNIPTDTARRIARFRSRTFLCKGNQKSSQVNMSCRAGCDSIETQEHLVNCTLIHGSGVTMMDTSFVKGTSPEADAAKLHRLSERLKAVEKWTEERSECAEDS